MSASIRILRERFQATPRFGFSNRFADLFSADEGVTRNYVYGLLVAGATVLSLFMFWIFVLLTFKCLGPKQVGFLSGAPFRATCPSNPVAVNPWIARGRIIVAGSCVIMMIFAILLARVGIENINATATTIGEGATMGYEYLYNAQEALVTVELGVLAVQQVRNSAVAQLIEFYADLIAARQAQMAGDVEEAISIVIESVEDLRDFFSENLRLINDALVGGQEQCMDVKAATEEVDLRGLQWGVGVVMTIVPALALACLWRNASPPLARNTKADRRVERCTTWFVLPVFSVMVLLSIKSCSGIVVAGLMNGDFCSGGYDQTPDSTVLDIMQEYGTSEDSVPYRLTEYFIRNCNLDPLLRGTPLEDVEALKSKINSTLIEIDNAFREIARIDTEQLSIELGYDVSEIQLQLLRLREPLRNLLGYIWDFIQRMACRPLYAIYYTMTHRAACTDSYTGLFWMFMSMIWISFFGLLVLTFRSALYPVSDADPFEWDLELEEKQLDGDAVNINQLGDGGDNEQALKTEDDDKRQGNGNGDVFYSTIQPAGDAEVDELLTGKQEAAASLLSEQEDGVRLEQSAPNESKGNTTTGDSEVFYSTTRDTCGESVDSGPFELSRFCSIIDSTTDPRTIEPRQSWVETSSPRKHHDKEQGIEAIYEEEPRMLAYGDDDSSSVAVRSLMVGSMPMD